MANDQIQRSPSGRSQRWLPTKKSCRKVEATDSDHEFTEETSAGDSSSSGQSCFTRVPVRPASSITHELRVFVGTWNVAGRSPTRNLVLDLDEWLNPKSEVDIYVLGFQEIVPLNTITIIGAEDHTEATRWNLLIGKTLNNKDGCVWLAPAASSNYPIATAAGDSADDYQYVRRFPSTKKKTAAAAAGISRSKTPMRERAKKSHDHQHRTGGSESSGSGSSASSSGSSSTYKLMASKKMVGVFISVWMRKELLTKYNISNVKVCSVACGIMGYLGNKGSVSVSMSIEGTSFCFVASHLASGEKKGDEGRRNQQVIEILKRTTFPRNPQDNDNNSTSTSPVTILRHDRIFWFGDLNYRLNLEDNSARELIKRNKFGELQKFDQLKKEQEESGVFEGWKEGNIEFAPTYKYYLSTSNRYSGTAPSRTGDKHRTPAWCDRILWFGKGIQQLSYVCGSSKFSDHRPVSSLFTTEIETLNTVNTKTVALSKFLASMNLTRHNGQMKKSGEEAKPVLKSLIITDMEEPLKSKN